MIEPIDVTTQSALSEIVKYSKRKDSEPILARLTTAFSDRYFLIDNGHIVMEICPKNKRDKTTIFFIFNIARLGFSKAVKLDGALDFMREDDKLADIATWFLFHLERFV